MRPIKAYRLSVILLAMLLALVLASGCANERERLDAAKQRVTQLLVQHSDLREFLENRLYALDDDVIIARYFVEARPDAVIYADGHLTFPEGYTRDWYEVVRDYESTITAIFQTFDCESISLSLPDSGDPSGPRKVLHVGFDDIKINDDVYHAQWLSYSSDGVAISGTGSYEKIFKDWYYSTPGYT